MNRHDRRERDQRRPPEKSSRSKNLRFLALLGIGLGAALLILRVDTKSDRVVTSPGPVKLAKLNARNLQETSELNGIDGGAKAGRAVLAVAERTKPGEDTRAGAVFIVAPFAETTSTDGSVTVAKADPQHPQAAIRIVGVRSEKAYTRREESIDDARRVARQRLAEVLQSLDPPIRVLPSDAQIADDYIVANSAREIAASQDTKDAWKAGGVDPNRQWATIDLEVSESQLRTLRAKQRLIDLGWILGAIAATLGLGYGALKLDALAKNYLTKATA